MLSTQPDANGQLLPALDRAHHLARAGLEEARRAIAALRDEDLPGPDRLEQLAADFELDSNVYTSLQITGIARDLDSETSLTIYRVVQEALTNIRKHATPAVDPTRPDPAARRTHPPRSSRPRTDRGRTLQRRDRRAAHRHRDHRQEPHQQSVWQDRRARPSTSGRLRLSARPRARIRQRLTAVDVLSATRQLPGLAENCACERCDGCFDLTRGRGPDFKVQSFDGEDDHPAGQPV